MQVIAALKERTVTTTRRHAVRAGRVPRRAYCHYYIEADGLHSRVHLQNFWSTFWPQYTAPACARVYVFAADGAPLGSTEREIPRFGSLFLEMRDVLREVGSEADEGMVAIDLAPPAELREALTELPGALTAEINTPYWMAYYDSTENYMYVHSIDKLGGEVFGTTRPVHWLLTRPRDRGERWRSWRLLELENLTELQVVVINHGVRPGTTSIGLHAADDDAPIVSRQLDLGPRQLRRVRFSADEFAAALARRPSTYGRIGLDPLLTGNGKPYVLLRYGDGPLSLHHG